jgi:hypothetical protein
MSNSEQTIRDYTVLYFGARSADQSDGLNLTWMIPNSSGKSSHCSIGLLTPNALPQRCPVRKNKTGFSNGRRASSRTGRDPGPTGSIAASSMPKQKQITRQAILKRIAEIDAKFQATEGWLHPTLSKLARERELLVEQANKQFKVDLKHEWR